ncbi:MAG: HupE/UreJ family protein, partial [Pseudomonadota bacterium]
MIFLKQLKALGPFILALCCLFGVLGGAAHAHPEDDFCEAGSGLDPVLCQQLAEANRSDAKIESPLLDEAGNVRSATSTALLYFDIGVQHILPGGKDHILFVLALFLASERLRSLIIQISAFTVAHTATLGFAAAGVLEPPASIVEPLIALSIAFVAVENLFFKDISKWRPLVVFGFGLFHGMGFAGFISEVGLPPDQFWSSLIGFN